MKKFCKIIAVMLAFLLTVGVIPFGTFSVAAATSGTTGGCTWKLDGTVLTISGNGKMANYSNSSLPWGKAITEVIINNGVTSIGDYTFYGCTGLTSITIPESVTSIGRSAFEDCTGLTSITIPESVTTIGYYAFRDCTGLTKINYNAKSVADFTSSSIVFYNAGTKGDGIDVVFGDNVKKIPAYLFDVYDSSYRPKIKSVTIGKNVTSIGYDAFYGCTGLESITIPESVTKIGSSAFSGCTGLTSVTIPESVTSIGDVAFRDCTGLTKINYNAKSVADLTYNSSVFFNAGTSGDGIDVVFGDSVERIPECLFFSNDSSCRPKIKSVTIGKNVTSIGERAFYGCTGLTSIKIPEGVTSIGNYAFSGCTGLTSIEIPEGVTSISSSAFRGCTGLESITVEKGNKKYHSAGNCLIETETKTLILGCNNSVIPTDGSVTSIGSYAFKDCTGLTSVTIPESVTSIGEYAFYGCIGLTSITIPESVTSIGSSAFSGCTGLTSVTIPESVTSIGSSAFYGCTGLTKINYNAKSVADFTRYSSVFYESGTKGDGIDVVFGDSVEKIPAYLFYESYSFATPKIKSVTAGKNVTYVGSGAFYNINLLQNQPDGLVYIGKVAYKYKGTCPSEIVIKDGTTQIFNSAFSGCTGLTSVTIPESVTSIGEYAFSGCTELTSIEIPESVTSIGAGAFEGCDVLTIYCYDEYFAKSYAKENNISYVILKRPDVEGIILKDGVENVTLEIGEVFTPQFERYPNDADRKVILTSNSDCVSIVDGKITAVSKGTATITATALSGVECDFCINVIDPNDVDYIFIDKMPLKLKYKVGESFDASGLIVNAKLLLGTFKKISDYTLSGFDSSTVGTKTVTVSYTYGENTYTAIFDVEIIDLCGIDVKRLPNKREYDLRTSFDKTGIVVLALYTDGSTEDVTDYTTKGFNALKTDIQTITVTYGDFTDTFNVAVGRKFDSGDTDGDGVITDGDTECLIDAILGEDIPLTSAFDTNSDGEIDVLDFIALKLMIETT